MPSMGRRKSVILNGILLTAASVTQASPMARRDSQHLDDDLSGENTKMRRRSDYGRKSRHVWPYQEEEDDFAARALGLTMAGLLARIRLLFGTSSINANQQGMDDEEGSSIYGEEGGINLSLEEQRLMVAILRKVVGMENEEEIEGWVKSGFPNIDKYKELHQKINKNLLQFYTANKYGNDIEEDNDNVHGDNEDGEWKEGQTETYGEAANIRKIFELFRFKKEEEIENHTEANNSIVIGFSMNVGMNEKGENEETASANKGPNNTKSSEEASMVNFILGKQTPGNVDIVSNV